MPIYCLNHFEVYSSVMVSTFLSVHPSPELFSSCKPDTLGPLNTKSPFPSPSNSWQPPFYFVSVFDDSASFIYVESYSGGDWLLSLSLISLRLPHVAWVRISFLFEAE